MFRRCFSSMVVMTLLLPVAGVHGQERGSHKPADTQATNPFSAFTQFSATMNGGIMSDGSTKVARSGNLVRVDYGDSYRITDVPKGHAWIVSPDRCNKFLHPDIGAYVFAPLSDLKLERSSTDEKETFDGHPCKIENLVIKRGDDVVANWKLWEAEDLKGFPVKVEIHRPNGVRTISFKDVSLQAPDPSLLKIPKHCAGFEGKAVPVAKPAPKAAAPNDNGAPTPNATPPK